MISIDGVEQKIDMSAMESLDDLFLHMVSGGSFSERTVTDIYLNKELFSEIYPYHAEDISIEEVETLEIVTEHNSAVLSAMLKETARTTSLMSLGAQGCIDYFRTGEETEGATLYKDLTSVISSFIETVFGFYEQYSLPNEKNFVEVTEQFSEIFTEMIEVLEDEDWVLLSDILEYDFIPNLNKWDEILASLDKVVQKNLI